MGKKIIVAYKGSLVDGGTMDVRDLGPALVAFGDLVSEANKVLNHDDSKVVVRVDADFKAGSFGIAMEISRSIASQVQMLFSGNTVSIDEIAGYIGFASSVVTVGGFATGKQSLIEFVKWVRGRKIEKVSPAGGGNMVVTIGDGNVIVNHAVLNLYASVPVRENLGKTLAPLERDGVDAFEARETDGRVVSSIGKDEAQYFNVGEEDAALTNTSRQDVLVKILSVSFEDLKWRLLFGNDKIHADIKDEEFAASVRDGRVSFTSGDVLSVNLEIHQVANKGMIKTSYSVLKVNRIIKRPQEISLPFDSEPSA